MLAGMLTCTLMANVQAAYAESADLKPTQTTKIQGNGKTSTNADVVLYDADATSWTCSYAKISNGAFKNELSGYDGTPVVLTKFDASSTLTGKMVTKATLTFKSICTVSSKNSKVQVAQVKTGWDATTATWNNTNTSDILGAVNLNGEGTSVATSEKTLTIDVTENLKASTDNTIGFGIYTATGREQKVYDFNLAVEYIDASASANITIKYVDGEGNEIKESVMRAESIGASISLKDDDKASVYNADKTKKYIYASDDSEGKTVASDGSTVITVKFREAATWSYSLNAVDGEGNTLKEGIVKDSNFEGETFNVAYPYALNIDGTLYTSKKQNNGFYFSLTLSEDAILKTVAFTASETTDIVYFSEAEDIESLTRATNNNTAIRSSCGASAYAADSDVIFTKLPAGKYKLTTVICDAAKNAGSVWNFTAGKDTIFKFTASKVNWSEGTSDEFFLADETDIALCKGGNANQAVDLIYIQRTGDYVAPEVVIEKFSDLYDLEDGTDVTIKTTDAVISVYTYSGTEMFVCAQDATGAIKLSSVMAQALGDMGIYAGSKIVGTVYAKYTAADGTPTLDIADSTGVSKIDPEAGYVEEVAPVEMTVAQAKEKTSLSRYVEVKKAKMWADEDDIFTFYISQGTDTIKVYDQFYGLSESFTAPDTIEYLKGVVVLLDGKNAISPYGKDAVPVQIFEAENIAALAEATEYSLVKLTLTDAKVTVVEKGRWSTTAYIEDESGALYFDGVDEELGLEAGMTVNGYIYATYTGNYGGMSIESSEEYTAKSEIEKEAGTPAPTATTIAEVKKESNINRFVSFKNAKMVTEKSEPDEEGYSYITAIYMVQGTDSIKVYDSFNALPVDSDNVTVVPDSLLSSEGIIGISDDEYMFFPTKIEEHKGDDTGIKAATNGTAVLSDNDAVYSISGVKVRKAGEKAGSLPKGLYIIGGKKVVVK